MGGLGQDLRITVRRLLRAPGFTFVTVLILALGIGANTALFSVLEQALRGTTQYPEVDRLVMVDLMLARNADTPADTFPWSYPKLRFAEERVRSIESMAGFALRLGTLTGAGDATRVAMEMVAPPYFGLLGVQPRLGRAFHESETPPMQGAVVILGHALWTTHFAADPDIAGRTITIDGVSFEVAGVMPADFRGLTGQAELWLPLAAFNALGTPARLRQPWTHWLRVVGRLQEGTTIEQARSELEVIGVAITEAYPDPSGGGAHGVTAVPFLRARVNPVAQLALAAVSTGGLLLLLIASANVAGLLFARASSRRGDVAVRTALGAGRGRLARESLLESLLLATVGGGAGLLLAFVGDDIVAAAVRYALETSGSRRLQYLDPDALRVDGAAAAVGAGLALVIGLLAGLLPLRVAAGADPSPHLRASRMVSQPRGAGETWRGVLVSLQLALTLILLAGAGLMASSFANLSAVEVGFSSDDVLVFRFDAGPGRTPDEARAFEAEAIVRLEALPGVLSVATAPCPPLSGPCEVTGVRRIDDNEPVDFGDMEAILTYEVSSEYFATLGVPLRSGRGFDAELTADDPPVAVVSEAAARKFFGGSALGHRIAVTHALTDERQAEIVGVVADVRYGALEADVIPAVYFSRSQAPSPYGTLLVRTAGDSGELVESVRAEVKALDPGLPLTGLTSLRELQAGATARTRVLLGLLLAFSALGLLLSAVGIYGVVSYDVHRRTRETGLRVALGASASNLLRSIVHRPALFALAGASLGLGGTLLLTRHLGALLYQVEASDPLVLAAATVLLVAVAITAAWIPARRALRLDPAETLRGE